MKEFTKGLGRGLGYGAAKCIINSMGSSHNKVNMFGKRYTSLSFLFYFLVFFTCMLPTCIWIPIYGWFRYNKNTTKISYAHEETIQVTDRRYDCGYRIDNIITMKTEHVTATEEDKAIYKKQAKYIFIFSAIFIVFNIIMLVVS